MSINEELILLNVLVGVIVFGLLAVCGIAIFDFIRD